MCNNSEDEYLRRVGQKIAERLDPMPLGKEVEYRIVRDDERLVLKVEVAKAPSPVWIKRKGQPEELYVRTSSMSQKLNTREANDYIHRTFPR